LNEALAGFSLNRCLCVAADTGSRIRRDPEAADVFKIAGGKKMDLYKNKASGKYFIHVEDTEKGKALFISPQGVFKSLELSLFESQEPSEEDYFLRRGLITQLQVERYHKYMGSP
jgi:hypothetical protein